MSVFLDGLILLILLLFVLNGIRKGIIRSIINFVGMIAAAYFSSFLGKALADWIYNSLFKQQIIDSVSNSVSNSIGQSTDNIINDIVNNLPGFIRGIVPDFTGSETLTDAISNGSDTAATAVEQIISPLLISLISIITITLLFAAFMILVRFVSIAASKACRIPGLLQANKTLGGILGFLSGSAFIMLIIVLINLFTNINIFDSVISEQVIDKTFLYKFYNNFNIFNLMFFNAVNTIV